jgi:hypothetical protein
MMNGPVLTYYIVGTYFGTLKGKCFQCLLATILGGVMDNNIIGTPYRKIGGPYPLIRIRQPCGIFYRILLVSLAQCL